MALEPTKDIAAGRLVNKAATRPSAPCPRPPRTLRRTSQEAAAIVDTACKGLFRIYGYDRHGIPLKIRLNWFHPLAIPFCCIFLAAIPFLTLWAAIVPFIRWHVRRDARRHNAMMLSKAPRNRE